MYVLVHVLNSYFGDSSDVDFRVNTEQTHGNLGSQKITILRDKK